MRQKQDAMTKFVESVQIEYDRLVRQIRRDIIDESLAEVEIVFDQLIDEPTTCPAKQALRTVRQRIRALKEPKP